MGGDTRRGRGPPRRKERAVMSTFAWCYHKGCLTPDNRRLVVAGLYGLRGPSGTGLTAEGRKLLRLRTATGRAQLGNRLRVPTFRFRRCYRRPPPRRPGLQQRRLGFAIDVRRGRCCMRSPPGLWRWCRVGGAPVLPPESVATVPVQAAAAVGFQTTSRRNARRRGGGPGEIATARSRMATNRTPPFPRISTP